MNNYYELLGIENIANQTEIKKAYKKKALQNHPDRNPNNKEDSEKKFKEISKAYSVLSDPEKKQIYDNFGEDGLNGDMGNVSPFDIFEQMFGESNIGGPFGGSPFGKMFNMASSMSDMSNKIEHSKKNIKITFKEMMCGGERSFIHKRKIIKNRNSINDCVNCNGKGKINKIIQMAPGFISQNTQLCGYCKGLGKIAEFELIDEKITFTINPGTKEGDNLVIKKKGNDCINNVTGDLIIFFEEEKKQDIERQNDDLIYLKQILLSEALCGLEFILEHPSNKNILVKYDNIIKPGDIKILYGLGFRKKNKFKNGNIIIKFNIIFPDSIGNTKQDLISKLLPRRTKLTDEEIADVSTYYLENIDQNIEDDSSSDNDSHNYNSSNNVQCAQQ